jgi:hypothetical protein
MEISEITSLISIRDYTNNALGNPALDRATIKELHGILILLDKKIIGLLRSEQFKEYIDYKDVQKAIYDVAMITNIKSGLKK